MITQNLRQQVDIAREALGDDSFTVVTVGFDWAVDTPEQMRLYASSRGIDVRTGTFLAATHESIERLAAILGFSSIPAPRVSIT